MEEEIVCNRERDLAVIHFIICLLEVVKRKDEKYKTRKIENHKNSRKCQ